MGPQVDILCFQEHKFQRNKAMNIGKTIWPNVVLWIAKANEGYTFERQQGTIGKGGTCIIMDPIWAKFVTDYTNMVEKKKDKSSMCGKLIPNKERVSWDALKLALEIHEPTRSSKSLKLSWDNQKNGGKIIMLGLD